jgi:hypothetical protein
VIYARTYSITASPSTFLLCHHYTANPKLLTQQAAGN